MSLVSLALFAGGDCGGFVLNGGGGGRGGCRDCGSGSVWHGLGSTGITCGPCGTFFLNLVPSVC